MAFEVIVSEEFGRKKIVLSNTASNTSAEVFSFGALLNNFSANCNNEIINVIEGFENIDDARKHLTPFFKSAKLSPYVCRVKDAAYTFGNQTHRLHKYTSGSNAMHGLLYDCEFHVADYRQNDAEASVVLEYVYDNVHEGFPFRYRCSVTYSLQPDNRLTISTKIKNEDHQLMPVTDGWHPYFTLGDTIDNYLLEFQCKSMIEFDKHLIPTGNTIPYHNFDSLTTLGNTFFDNCFALDFTECQPLCVLRNPAKKIQVEFYPDKSYPYLQIYTPDSRKSIAIENLSALPDAFNNGVDLIVLQPQQEATFSVQYKIRCL